VDIGFVVHVHVFNVHRGSIAFRDHLKAGHDTSQFSLCTYSSLILNNDDEGDDVHFDDPTSNKR